jgi:hypothetical protein
MVIEPARHSLFVMLIGQLHGPGKTARGARVSLGQVHGEGQLGSYD